VLAVKWQHRMVATIREERPVVSSQETVSGRGKYADIEVLNV